MEEIKTKGIILNTTDYGEADKIATVFSLEYGKISVKFNGVKKQKAKLKPLVQPFSFVEIECFKRGDFFTAKTGLVVDNFPKITTDFTRTICAYILMEIISKVLPKNKIEPEIFLTLSNTLDSLETNNPYTTTIKFILEFFDLIGERLITDIEGNHIYLDLDLGNFTQIKTPNSIEIDKRCYKIICNINNNVVNSTDDKTNATDDTNNKDKVNKNDIVNKMTLKMLNNVFRSKYDIELNSFSFL